MDKMHGWGIIFNFVFKQKSGPVDYQPARLSYILNFSNLESADFGSTA